VCGREIQNSIKESVYSVLTDLIQQHNLNFEVQAKTLIHRESKTEINFRGFRDQGRFNTQGMEGIDIVWIDESQALTKQTLDILIPTIRKDNSKIIFTMNRFVRNDPAYAQFVGREDCLHIKINYDDNPYCTNKLLKEAQECKQKSMEDFNHIWLGLPLDKTEDQVFTHSELDSAKANKYPMRQGYGTRIAGFDIARFGDDKCAAVILQQMGSLHWETVQVIGWDHKDSVFTQGKIGEIVREYKIDRAIVDCDGLGSMAYDNVKYGTKEGLYHEFHNTQLGYDRSKDYGNERTVNAYKVKDMLLKGQLCFIDSGLLDELETMRYEFDNQQRRILVSKDKMKRQGVKSPNMADALIMAVSLIDSVKTEQDNQYGHIRARKAQTDNLFDIAGIR
jgi:phage terminase large subunit